MNILFKAFLLNLLLMSSVSASELGEKKDLKIFLREQIQVLEYKLDKTIKSVADINELMITVREIKNLFFEQESADIASHIGTGFQNEDQANLLSNLEISGYSHNKYLRIAAQKIESIPMILSNPEVYRDNFKNQKVKESYFLLKEIHEKKSELRELTLISNN